MKIHKYTLNDGLGVQTLDLPNGSEFLHAAFQQGQMRIWMRVHENAPKEATEFCVAFTGDEILPGWQHRATLLEGYLVHHLFERISS